MKNPQWRVREGAGGTRLSGHTLRHEGHPYDSHGLLVGGRVGRAMCSCGALSPWLDSNNQRKRWHNAHKAEVMRLGNHGDDELYDHCGCCHHSRRSGCGGPDCPCREDLFR